MVSLRKRFAELIPELTKFGVVGLIGSVIDLGGAAYLHGAVGIGPMVSKGLSIIAATVVTYLGSRFWTFRHRVNQPMLREGTLFVTLNIVGLAIAECVIALVTYGLDMKGALAYNAASVVGTGLGTIFRYFSYKKWVFLAGTPGAAVAAGEAAVSGIVDAADTAEASDTTGAGTGPALVTTRRPLRGPADRLGACLERMPGQEDREGGRLRLDQHHTAAVRRRHCPRQRQPEPSPLGTTADAPLEDPGHQFRRDALALVPDLDHDRTSTLRGLQGHRPAAVHERVVQQRGEHLGQPARGDVSLQAARADHHELALRPAERRLPLDDLLPDDLVDAGEGGRSRGRPPGRAEQLGHHVGQALGLAEGGAAFLPDHLGVVRRRDHLFQPHRQGGQRGAQLVRGVHRELTIRGQQATEPARGRVEPVGHLV
jgi:putative flippase GtrA